MSCLRYFILVGVLTTMASPAFAYIDPGVGSLMLQALVGSLAAAIAIVSTYYQKIKFWMLSCFSKKKIESINHLNNDSHVNDTNKST